MKLADFLEPKDRDGLLGDLTEAGASRRDVFFQVLWLLIRRHGLPWIYLLVLGIYSARRFFLDSNDAQFPCGHAPWWFASVCFIFAGWSFMMARMLWDAGRALWLNAVFGSAVQLTATLYLNVGSAHGSAVTLLSRMVLTFVLGPSLILIIALWLERHRGVGRQAS